jgi:osmotically-inducible protein OsmY
LTSAAKWQQSGNRCGLCFEFRFEEIYMAKRYEDRYGRGSQRRDRGHADDRGYMDRASDEVRSWFGDDDAERRRHIDEQRDRGREPRYESERYRGDWSRAESPRRDDEGVWPRFHYQHAQAERRPGDRSAHWRDAPRDDRARYEDWNRTWSASDWGRERSMRDRDWPDRETEWNTAYPSSTGRSGWSTDEGRMEFRDQRWGRGPKGYQRSDSRIHEEVCDRLTYSNVDAENIEVTVTSAEVTLSGTVRDRWDKRRAEDLVEEVAGVREVHNSIRVTRDDRGIGQSESSATDQPGTVLGVNPTADAGPNTRRRS